MWSGTSALKSIDQSLQSIRNDVVRLDSQLSQLTQKVASNQRQRNQLINSIARIRLSEIESGDLLQTLSAADHDAVAILQQRESALTALNNEITQLNQQLSSLEGEREKMLKKLNKNSQHIVDVEAKVQAQLKVDQAYLSQLEVARIADSVAQESNNKVEMAQADMAEKAKPYQADDLFMYLYNRGFGTTEYDAGLIARFIDGWVAKLIKYENARVNYWNLTEIPKRLEQHAQASINAADEASMAVQQLELDALEQAGINDLNQQLTKSREEMDKFDDTMEDVETNLNKKLEDRARFAAGQDDYLLRSVTRLTQALEHQDLQAVHRYVRATASPTDDQLVIELQALDDQLDDAGDDLRDVRVLHDNKITRLKELEGVRRNFKNSRFDDVRSGFGSQSLLTGVLGEFLQGLISGSDLWRVIQRNQRYRNVGSIPDFGSGSLGRGSLNDIADLLGGGVAGQSRRPTRQRRSSWNWPTPRRGGGGFRIPSGGRSSGGFKTGGGF